MARGEVQTAISESASQRAAASTMLADFGIFRIVQTVGHRAKNPLAHPGHTQFFNGPPELRAIHTVAVIDSPGCQGRSVQLTRGHPGSGLREMVPHLASGIIARLVTYWEPRRNPRSLLFGRIECRGHEIDFPYDYVAARCFGADWWWTLDIIRQRDFQVFGCRLFHKPWRRPLNIR